MFSDKIGQVAVNGLINAGATDFMGGSRLTKTHEYNIWKMLTVKEKEWIIEKIYNDNNTIPSSLLSVLKDLLENRKKTSLPRKKKIGDLIKNLEETPFSVKDDAAYLASQELELLGASITCGNLDACNTTLEPDSTCKEFLQGKSGKISLAVEIKGCNEYIIKRGKMIGQKMMFLSVEDRTGMLDSVVVFPGVLNTSEPLLYSGSTVFLMGKRDNNRRDSFIVENVKQI